MIIDFDKIDEVINENYYNGKKAMRGKIYNDGRNKFGKVKLIPGASIGLHTHKGSCEVIYILGGKGKFIYDGEEGILEEGMVHYCPEGKSHSIVNNSDKDLDLFVVIPEQK